MVENGGGMGHGNGQGSDFLLLDMGMPARADGGEGGQEVYMQQQLVEGQVRLSLFSPPPFPSLFFSARDDAERTGNRIHT